MINIDRVVAYEVLDSRGFPTIEVEISAGDFVARAIVPSGASTGIHEALELRDGDKDRFGGKGVLKAVSNANGVLSEVLVGQSLEGLAFLDKLMIDADGTDNKTSIGANAILGCSMALARLKALSDGVELKDVLGGGSVLPVPMMNVVNGGAHADNVLDFQEFMIVPAGFDSFSDALRAGSEIYHVLKSLLKSKNLVTAVGDEGGFAPDAGGPREVLGLLVEAIESAGYKAGEQVWLAMDVAASEFFVDGKYDLKGEGRVMSSLEMVDYYSELVADFPLFSIEDGMAEDDFDGWKILNDRLGDKIQIVGDDLFVTNMKRLEIGFERGLANSILIKLNQIGSVDETLSVISAAVEHGYTCVVSHRSGETEDSFIADLAVGCASGQIKTGAPCRSDRVSKYNQLLRLERLLGSEGSYAGLTVIK